MKPRCIYAALARDPNSTTGDGIRGSAERGDETAKKCLRCTGTRAGAVKVDCRGRFYYTEDGIRVTGPNDLGMFKYVDIEKEKRIRELEEFAEKGIAEIRRMQAEIDRSIAELGAA